MSAVIYIRVSTSEQVENFSLAAQLKGCGDYRQREGLEVDQVFEDGGCSAKTLDRPDFQKMIAYCKEHRKRITHVITYNLSRFSRDLTDQLVMERELFRLKISLRSVTESFDDSAAGKLVGSFAEFDNTSRGERSIAGMRSAIEDGRFTYKAPIGYRNVSAQRGEANLIPDLEVAPLILKCFELFADTPQTAAQVQAEVTDLGLRTKKGKAMSPQSFGQMLRRELYTGIIESVAWQLRIKGAFQSVVSEALFA